MQPDENYDTDLNRSPAPDQGGSPDEFQPLAKVGEKMEKLAKWRIDPSSIDFPEDAPELRGGNATVSRALLTLNSNNERGQNESGTGSPTSQKIVAVKKLDLTADTDLERLLRLTLREAGLLADISHQNIVKLEGIVEDVSSGILWLVFPWEDNGNLRDCIASQDWEIPERISLLHDVARGLEYLHSQKPPICHGDLKSASPDAYRAVITDFGSARRVAEAEPDAQTKQAGNEQDQNPPLQASFSASANTITITGNQYTLRWAAPELLRDDEPPTLKIDIWAFGWIAYEIMTDSIPFQDVINGIQIIVRVIKGHLPSIIGDARMSLILELCSMMSQCWNTRPSKRPTAESCRKMIHWMPKVFPSKTKTENATASAARSPELLLKLGEMYMHQRDYPKASKYYNEALDIYANTADTKGKAGALRWLAELHRLQRKYNEAVTVYSEVLKIYNDIGDRGASAIVLCGLAEVHKMRKEYGKATTRYSEALQILTEVGDKHGRASVLQGLAEVHLRQKEYSQAVSFYSDAMQIYVDLGDRHGRASTLFGIALVHETQREDIEALHLFNEALEIFTDLGDANGRAGTLWGVARALCKVDRYEMAISFYEEAAESFEQYGDTTTSARVLKDADRIRRLMDLDGAA